MKPKITNCPQCATMRHNLAQYQTVAQLTDALHGRLEEKIDRLQAERDELQRIVGEQAERIMRLENSIRFMVDQLQGNEIAQLFSQAEIGAEE